MGGPKCLNVDKVAKDHRPAPQSSHRYVCNLPLQCAIEASQPAALLHRGYRPERVVRGVACLLSLQLQQDPPGRVHKFLTLGEGHELVESGVIVLRATVGVSQVG